MSSCPFPARAREELTPDRLSLVGFAEESQGTLRHSSTCGGSEGEWGCPVLSRLQQKA